MLRAGCKPVRGGRMHVCMCCKRPCAGGPCGLMAGAVLQDKHCLGLHAFVAFLRVRE